MVHVVNLKHVGLVLVSALTFVESFCSHRQFDPPYIKNQSRCHQTTLFLDSKHAKILCSCCPVSVQRSPTLSLFGGLLRDGEDRER